MTVEDNGQGIPAPAQTKPGNGTLNMHSRLEQIEAGAKSNPDPVAAA